MRLEGKVAIVTGGGSGFGEGIATKFVAEGAQVLIADRDRGRRRARREGARRSGAQRRRRRVARPPT